MNHHRNTNEEPMDFSQAHYIKGLYNSIAPEIIVIGGTQVMKSEWLIIDHLAMAYEGNSVFFIIRNGEARDVYVQSRVNAVIDVVPFYKGVMREMVFNRLDIKKFGKGKIKYANSAIQSEMREFPARCEDVRTPICTLKGTVPLGDLRPGDAIYSRNESGDRVVDYVVYNVFTGSKPAFELRMKSGKCVNSSLQHRFLTDNGWKALHEFCQYETCKHHSDGSVEPDFQFLNTRRNLCIEGTMLETANGLEEVSSITFVGFREMCDIQTKTHHNFYSDGIVSHNCLHVDELNDCNWDNVKFGFSRLDGNPHKFKRFVSNSGHSESPAEKLYEESTKLQWNVPCKACSKPCDLDWFSSVVETVTDNSGNVVDYLLRDREWSVGCGRDIHCICPNCGGILDRMSSSGEWIAQRPGPFMEGYHIPSLCSPIVSVSEMWREFRPAFNDPFEMQRFYVRRLALPYSAVGNRLTNSLFERCIRDYEFIIQPDRAFIKNESSPGPCSMGIDMGAESCDVRISEVLGNGRRRAVFIGKISTRVFEDAVRELITQYNVAKVCIDIQPEQALVTEFQENCTDADVWLVKVSGAKDKSETKNEMKRIVSPSRTEILDRTYGQIKSGKNEIPKNYADILGGTYVDEMIASVREMKMDQSGNAFFSWESSGRPDHSRFADAYDYIACKMIQDDDCIVDSSCIFDYRSK
jgi:Phage terminase large subunit (GpA)